MVSPSWGFFDLKEQTRRSERKNRDEFRKLMEGHVAAGILTAKTHWQDYCLKVTLSRLFLSVLKLIPIRCDGGIGDA